MLVDTTGVGLDHRTGVEWVSAVESGGVESTDAVPACAMVLVIVIWCVITEVSRIQGLSADPVEIGLERRETAAQVLCLMAGLRDFAVVSGSVRVSEFAEANVLEDRKLDAVKKLASLDLTLCALDGDVNTVAFPSKP